MQIKSTKICDIYLPGKWTFKHFIKIGELTRENINDRWSYSSTCWKFLGGLFCRNCFPICAYWGKCQLFVMSSVVAYGRIKCQQLIIREITEWYCQLDVLKLRNKMQRDSHDNWPLTWLNWTRSGSSTPYRYSKVCVDNHRETWCEQFTSSLPCFLHKSGKQTLADPEAAWGHTPPQPPSSGKNKS